MPLWLLAVLLALTLPRLSDRLNVFSYAPCFVSGVVAFDLTRSRSWPRKLPSWAWPLVIALAVALFGPHDNISLGAKIQRAWIVSLLLGAFYASVKEGHDGPFQTVLHWIAEHSYGIYLSHSIVIWFTLDLLAGSPLWTPIALLAAGAIGLPRLLYLLIERPMMNLGTRTSKAVLEPARKFEEPSFASELRSNRLPGEDLPGAHPTWNLSAPIESLATSTNLSIRQIQSKIAGQASRGFIGEITKQARAVHPDPL